MKKERKSRKLGVVFRDHLMVGMAIAFVITMVLLSTMQKRIAKENAFELLKINSEDVQNDIMDASDNSILNFADMVKSDYELFIDPEYKEKADTILETFSIDEGNFKQSVVEYLKRSYTLSEVSVADETGHIIASTNKEFVGYDMASGEQSAEFLCLLDGTKTFAQPYGPISYDNTISRKYGAVALDEGGFIQIGYDKDRFQEIIDSAAYSAAKNRHVGESGYLAIVNEDGDIVSSPREIYNGRNIYEMGYTTEEFDQYITQDVFQREIGGETYIGIVSEAEGYYIIALIPEEEMERSMAKTITMTNVLEVASFIMIIILIYHIVRQIVIKNMDKITTSLDEISKGNLNVSVNAKGIVEFESLSDNINGTVAALKESAEKETERINAELEYAKSIQRAALPMVFPPFPDRKDFDIYATMTPAKEVGGDFFDFELISGSQLGFCIADVSGKGVPAALFMMRAKTLIKSYGMTGLNPAEILEMVNNELVSGNSAGMFVTCWLGILNTDTGIIEYANAGHNPPLILKGGKEFEYLKSERPGFVLGGMENVKYKKHEVFLKKGDEIFLYTDGVTEATNSDMVLYGEERLKSLLDSITNETCENKCHQLRENIDAFVGTAPQFDDITMLSIKYSGGEEIHTTEASMENFNEMMGFIDENLEKLECPMAAATKFDVAADEILSNIIKFAYGDAIGYMSVIVEKAREQNGVSLTFVDKGIPFNPLDNPDPDVSLKAEDREVGKLGLYMVKKLMDKVEYEYLNGNRLKITKYY